MNVVGFLAAYLGGEIDYHDVLFKDDKYKLKRIYVDGDREEIIMAEGLGNSLQHIVNNELDYFFVATDDEEKIQLEFSFNNSIIKGRAMEDFIYTTGTAIDNSYEAIDIIAYNWKDDSKIVYRRATIFVHDSYINMLTDYMKKLKQTLNDRAVFITNKYVLTKENGDLTVIRI